MAQGDVVQNPETGETFILNGIDWVPLGPEEAESAVKAAELGKSGAFLSGMARGMGAGFFNDAPELFEAQETQFPVSTAVGSLAPTILLPGIGFGGQLAAGAVKTAQAIGRLGTGARIAGKVDKANKARKLTLTQRAGGDTTLIGRNLARARQLAEGTPILGAGLQKATATRLRQQGGRLIDYLTDGNAAAVKAAERPNGLLPQLNKARKVNKEEFNRLDGAVESAFKGPNNAGAADDAEVLVQQLIAENPKLLTAKSRALLEKSDNHGKNLTTLRKRYNELLGNAKTNEEAVELQNRIDAIDELIELSLPESVKDAYAVVRSKWRVQEAALRGKAVRRDGTINAETMADNLQRSFGADFKLGEPVRGSESLNGYLQEALADAQLAATQKPPFQPGLATALALGGAAAGGAAGIFSK